MSAVGAGTARSGRSDGFVSMLLRRLPQPILNVGAGYTVASAAAVDCVSVDLEVPPVAPTGLDRFAVADGLRLPFRDGSFAGVLLKDVLEHVDDSIGLLRELHRVLQPEGRFFIVTPRAIPRAVWDDPTHVRGFTRRALRTATEAAGLSLVREPVRIGGLPGAGRLGLEHRLVEIMRVPGIGHWFGTNWLAEGARRG